MYEYEYLFTPAAFRGNLYHFLASLTAIRRTVSPLNMQKSCTLDIVARLVYFPCLQRAYVRLLNLSSSGLEASLWLDIFLVL